MSVDRMRVLSVLTRAVISILILVGALVIFVALYRSSPSPAMVGNDQPAPRVQVFKARPVPVYRTWDGFGTARAMDSTDVPARVTATVIELPDEIQPGVAVAREQLLVRLDESDFARQVEISTQAIADLDARLERLGIEVATWTDRVELARDDAELARAEHERVQEAFERGAARPREVDAAKQAWLRARRDEIAARAELDMLEPQRASLLAQRAGQEASLRLARQSVERCTIASPLEGVIQAVDIEAGENLQSGQRVARVVSLRRMEIPLRLPADARPFVRVRDPVTLRASGAVDLEWSATVSRIAPEDDEATRTTTVYAELEQDPADPAGLRPGRFVRGRIMSRVAEARWIVPRRSVISEQVFVVADGGVINARPIEVAYHTTGRYDEFGVLDRQWVVLRAGLTDEALVVLNAGPRLTSGMRVDPVLSSEGATAMREGAPAEASP